MTGDDRADALCRRSQRIVKQVRVSRRRPGLSMTEQCADHRQAQPGARKDGGVGVPQIVHTDATEARLGADRAPWPLDLDHVTVALLALARDASDISFC